MITKTPSELKNIGIDLMDDKALIITKTISKIRIDEINSDEKFNNVIKEIYNRLMLEKVILGDPQIISHEEVTKEHVKTHLNPHGNSFKTLQVEVEIPYSGSSELLSYHPNGYMFSNDIFPNVILPDSDNCISVLVEGVKYDKHDVLNAVEKMLSLTKQFIGSNNQQVDHFNNLILSRTRNELALHREKMNRLYN